MAAKKKSASKVTITIDIDALRKLAEAVDALSEFAAATNMGADDPAVRKELTKKGPKKSAKKATKRR